MNRIEIEIKLNRDRAWLLETLAATDPEELGRGVTDSQHDGGATKWSMKDHFIHTTLVEKNFNAMIRRFLEGHQNPVGLRTRDDGSERTWDEVMAVVHAMTEEWKVAHQDKSLDELVAIGAAVRGETLQLLSELTDEQLQEKLPGAPWADGTIGGVLAVNADHGRAHYGYAKDGLAGAATATAGPG